MLLRLCLHTNLDSVRDVIPAHAGEGGVVLLRVVVVMVVKWVWVGVWMVVVVVVLAERVGHSAAQAIVAQETHQRVALARGDAVAGEGRGGAGGVRR